VSAVRLQREGKHDKTPYKNGEYTVEYNKNRKKRENLYSEELCRLDGAMWTKV
jgi:hypothetical protein